MTAAKCPRPNSPLPTRHHSPPPPTDISYQLRVAPIDVVLEGRIEDAKRYLIKAGRTPGSPQSDSFGPEFGLTQGLLERGERETVLEYFWLCSRFRRNNCLALMGEYRHRNGRDCSVKGIIPH